MDFYEHAVGPCIICGKESEGSLYWLPMSDAQWAVIRPVVTPLFQPHMVQNVLFFPGLCRPFCGPKCVSKHYEGVAADHCKTGG